MISENSGLREAPPTRNPSISGLAASSRGKLLNSSNKDEAYLCSSFRWQIHRKGFGRNQRLPERPQFWATVGASREYPELALELLLCQFRLPKLARRRWQPWTSRWRFPRWFQLNTWEIWKAYLDEAHLVEDNFFSFTGFSLFELLANAWNNAEPSFEGFFDLLSDELIRLAKDVSSLRVAEDHPVDAKIS